MPVRAGQKARLEGEERDVLVDEVFSDRARLADGRVVAAALLWPLAPPDDPVDRLGALQTDRAAAFRNRLDGLLLTEVRQARGLGSFLGGRISIFPHQLHVAERATASDPVRWLLADEVGLGKTIEACLILSRLLRTDRADRALVVAPATLTVQWLGELYRKFHQTFVLLDRRRRDDVAKEHGEGFNPFEAHRRAIVALEDLTGEPGLSQKAQAAGFDLLVVDEAHRLERARGEAGSDAYLAVAPLTRAARHVLLLSATPLESDPHAFFRLLELLRPDAYTSEEAFLASLRRDEPLPPCTSATRRVDIGGLQPRVPMPVDLDAFPRGRGLTGDDAADADDPRVAWIAGQDADWRADGTGEDARLRPRARDALRPQGAPGVGDAQARRDLPRGAHARARRRRGRRVPARGRPVDPRLDGGRRRGPELRVLPPARALRPAGATRPPSSSGSDASTASTGRLPVEIVYFRPPDGFGREIVTLFERIGLFTSPLGGLERSLSEVEARVARATARSAGRCPSRSSPRTSRGPAEAREKAVYHHLHRDGFSPEKAPGILARVPADLDARTERFVLDAADLFGFETAERAGRRTWYVEFGADALVEHLPGVAGGSRWLGTFDRGGGRREGGARLLRVGARARRRDSSASSRTGRAGASPSSRLENGGRLGSGPPVRFRRGAAVEFVAASLDGREQPAWAELIVSRRARDARHPARGLDGPPRARLALGPRARLGRPRAPRREEGARGPPRPQARGRRGVPAERADRGTSRRLRGHRLAGDVMSHARRVALFARRRPVRRRDRPRRAHVRRSPRERAAPDGRRSTGSSPSRSSRRRRAMAGKIREAARASGDEANEAKALVREVQLRTALHGYETSVRFLKDQPWPQGLLPRTTLRLFYAQSLVTYAQAYSWEIGQREKVESAGPVDLKAWTRDQIQAEAVRAYVDVWKDREALGHVPVERDRGLRRAEQLPEGDPRHAPRRRVVSLRRASRRHVGLEARAVERRLRARREGARRRRRRAFTVGEARRPGRPSAPEARRRPRRPRSLARRGRGEGSRARGAPRAAPASRGGPDGRRGPRRDPTGPRDAPAGVRGRPVVLDGEGPARGLRPRGRQAREPRARALSRPRGDPGVSEVARSGTGAGRSSGRSRRPTGRWPRWRRTARAAARSRSRTGTSRRSTSARMRWTSRPGSAARATTTSSRRARSSTSSSHGRRRPRRSRPLSRRRRTTSRTARS